MSIHNPFPARGRASREEVGCFIFFTWPVLLAFMVFQGFFEMIGWLFGERD
jgi:hypothetical protein